MNGSHCIWCGARTGCDGFHEDCPERAYWLDVDDSELVEP